MRTSGRKLFAACLPPDRVGALGERKIGSVQPARKTRQLSHEPLDDDAGIDGSLIAVLARQSVEAARRYRPSRLRCQRIRFVRPLPEDDSSRSRFEFSRAPRAWDNLSDNAVYWLPVRNFLRRMTRSNECCTSPASSRRVRPSPTTERAFRGISRTILRGRSSRASRTAWAESVPCGVGTGWGKPDLSA